MGTSSKSSFQSDKSWNIYKKNSQLAIKDNFKEKKISGISSKRQYQSDETEWSTWISSGK